MGRKETVPFQGSQLKFENRNDPRQGKVIESIESNRHVDVYHHVAALAESRIISD